MTFHIKDPDFLKTMDDKGMDTFIVQMKDKDGKDRFFRFKRKDLVDMGSEDGQSNITINNVEEITPPELEISIDRRYPEVDVEW